MDSPFEPLLVRHKEAQRALGCGNSKYWELVKAGEIEVDATVEPIGATGPHGFDTQPGQPAKATDSHKH